MPIWRAQPLPRALVTGLLAFPALAAFGLFTFTPLAAVVRYAGWEWTGTSQPQPVGLANVAALFRDADLWASLGVTIAFAAIVLPAFLGLSFAIAFALEGLQIERLIKAVLFAPGLVTVAGSAIAWFLLYDPNFGLVVDLTGLALPWTTQGWAALMYVALFTLWQQTGYGVLIASAALKGVPAGVKEAARLDGASEGQIRRLVVLPLLRPTATFLLVVGTVFALQSYTAVYLLTRGGPLGSTRVLGYYLYETAFERFNLGYASALTLFVLVVAFAVAATQARFLSDRRAAP